MNESALRHSNGIFRSVSDSVVAATSETNISVSAQHFETFHREFSIQSGVYLVLLKYIQHAHFSHAKNITC